MWYRARVNQFGELVIPQPSSVRQGTSSSGPRLARLSPRLSPPTNQPTTTTELCYHVAAWGIPLAITIWPTIFHHQEHGLWQYDTPHTTHTHTTHTHTHTHTAHAQTARELMVRPRVERE